MKNLIALGVIAAALQTGGAWAAEFVQRGDNTWEMMYTQEEKDASNAKYDINDETIGVAMDAVNAKINECEKDKKMRWVADPRSNFNAGVCIDRNPCKSKNNGIKEEYCVDVFKKVQLGSPVDVPQIINLYVKNVLEWEGAGNVYCANLQIPDSKKVGQDYVLCEKVGENRANGKNSIGSFRMFEFGDLSESNNRLGRAHQKYALCIALKGNVSGQVPKRNVEEVVCKGVSEDDCENVLIGTYKSRGQECRIIIR